MIEAKQFEKAVIVYFKSQFCLRLCEEIVGTSVAMAEAPVEELVGIRRTIQL